MQGYLTRITEEEKINLHTNLKKSSKREIIPFDVII